MSTWEIALLVVLGGAILLKGLLILVAVDSGMELWYRREARRHGFDPDPLPRRFRGRSK